MKKLISLIITLCTALSCIIPVYADLEITVNLNGAKITFDQPPIIQNDRTLVPMRAIFEALGCLVFWDEEDRSVEAWQGGVYIMTLWVNDYNMKLGNSDYITLDVPPTIINDRTLVPLRAISESMGAEVEWNGATHTVDISYNRTSYYPQAECNHTNTIEATVKGIGNFENTGSSTTHKVTEYVETVCENCRDTIDTKEKERTETHNFEDNVCVDCGYKKKISCSHSNTHDVISIDAREYENTSSSSAHKVIDEVEVYCDDCNEQIDTKYKKSDKPHNFEGNICVDCGYELGQTTQTEDYIELRNANLINQYADHPLSSCTWSDKNKLKFHLISIIDKDCNLELGDKTCAYVEYSLNGKYSKITGKILGSPSAAYINIYIDGEKYLMTEKMGSKSEKDIDLDISGAQTLRIEAYSTIHNSLSNRYPDIYLDDAKLWH